MSNQHFEEYLKNRFGDYSPDVDPRILEKIMEKRRKRRPAALWSLLLHNRNRLLIFILVLTGSATLLYTQINKSEKNTTDQKNNTLSYNNTPSGGQTGGNTVSPDNKTTISADANSNPGNSYDIADAAPGNHAPNAGSQNPAVSDPANSTNSTHSEDPTLPNNRKQNNKSTAQFTQAVNNDIKGADKTILLRNKNSTTKNTTTFPNGKNNNDGNDLTDIKNYNSRKIKGSRSGHTKMRISAPAASETLNTKEKNVIENNEEQVTANEDPQLPAGGTMLGRLSFLAEKIMSKKGPKPAPPLSSRTNIFLPGCPSIDNISGNKKYLELYASADYGIRSFKSFSDTSNINYLNRRKESTRFTSGYSAGVRYTRVFNNSMSIRAGVNYSQINEQFKFSQGNVVQITYIINQHGDTTGSFTTTGTRIKSTHNKYRSLDIPLLIGYEVGNGRFHANINAGAIVNVYSWQKGEILDTAFQPVNITTGKGDPAYQYKTNAGIGITGGVSLYYKLNDRWHILAEPYFRYNLSPMNTEKASPLQQRYHTAGLRLGIRLDLP